MKVQSIIQDQIHISDNVNSKKTHEALTKGALDNYGYTLDVSMRNGDGFGVENLDSFEDIKAKASVKNVALESNANAVMSNSMSKEDFAEYMKEGYSPSNMDIEETVTNLDKIKAKLLESGVVINGYTDTVSNSELVKITGSQATANVIKDALDSENVPVTNENVQAISDLIEISKDLSEPTDETKKYMIGNDLNPTVENFYKAEYSSAADSGRRAAYYIDNTGYASIKPSNADFDELKPQIERIIENANLSVNADTINQAKWLLDKDIPVTGENIKKLNDINNVSFPISERQVAVTSAIAIADGMNVKYADLNKTESYAKQAIKAIDEFNKEYDRGINADDDVKKHRMLEEIRLHMSVEANIHLLKKGISIDTKDLEMLVDELKKAEKEIYRPLLLNVNESDNNKLNNRQDTEAVSDKELEKRIGIYKETTKAVANIASNPLEATAELLFSNEKLTIESVENAGTKLKADYEKAGRAYEELMTAPRKDMGDSIKKAFRNVDDILNDLNLEVSRINEKAIRSLGYAGIEINEKNIEELSKANTAVENVISLMTPKKTLEMIRNGRNPLETDIFELEEELKADSVKEESDNNEKFSEFLIRLEKRHEISADERAAFIGVYRLFNKIEKSDGGLTGKVLKSDEKLTLKNLLTALRSDRAAGSDYKIDDSFGAVEKLITYGESITDQILQGFRSGNASSGSGENTNIMNQSDEYVDEKYSEMKTALNTEESIRDALKQADEPVTVTNILAMDGLMNSRDSLFEKLNKRNDRENTKIKDLIKNLHENFSSKESADEAYSELLKEAGDQIKDTMDEISPIEYVDLKTLNITNKQLSICSSMAKNNTYEVPVEINGKATTINVKLIKDSDETGKVSASFETEEFGKVNAEFKVVGNKASGFIVASLESAINDIKKKENILKDKINSIGIELDSIYYTNNADINISSNYISGNTDRVPTNDLYNIAKAFIDVMNE